MRLFSMFLVHQAARAQGLQATFWALTLPWQARTSPVHYFEVLTGGREPQALHMCLRVGITAARHARGLPAPPAAQLT